MPKVLYLVWDDNNESFEDHSRDLVGVFFEGQEGDAVAFGRSKLYYRENAGYPGRERPAYSGNTVTVERYDIPDGKTWADVSPVVIEESNKAVAMNTVAVKIKEELTAQYDRRKANIDKERDAEIARLTTKRLREMGFVLKAA